MNAVDNIPAIGSFGDLVWAVEPTAMAKYAARADHQPQPSQAVGVDRQQVSGASIAVLNLSGVMVQHRRYEDEISTPSLIAAAHALRADSSVDAVLVIGDSPGGSAAMVDQLADAFEELAAAKPAMAHVPSIACSACYYALSALDAVYADADAMVGSIGTRLTLYDYSGFFEQAGVRLVDISSGEFKSTGAIGSEVTEEQKKYLRESILDPTQELFVARVQKGRGLSGSRLQAVLDAKVHMPKAALDLGLIDGIQKIDATIGALVNQVSQRGPAAPTSTFAAPPQNPTERDAMSENAVEADAPQAATLQELEDMFPSASAEFVMSQLKAGATPLGATKAYAELQAAEVERLKAEAEENLARAEKAEKDRDASSASAKTRRLGNRPVGQADADADGEEPSDFYAMAKAVQKESGCTWNDATYLVRKKHPESHAWFRQNGGRKRDD